MDAQLLIVLVGLLFNFVAMIVGGLSFAWKVWQWLSSMKSEMGERLSAVETDVKHLLRAQGVTKREGEQHGHVHRQIRG